MYIIAFYEEDYTDGGGGNFVPIYQTKKELSKEEKLNICRQYIEEEYNDDGNQHFTYNEEYFFDTGYEAHVRSEDYDFIASFEFYQQTDEEGWIRRLY